TYCSEKCRNKARGRRYYYERGGKEKMHDRAMTPRGKMLARMNARRKRERDKLRQIEIVERTRPLVKCEFCGELFGQGKSTQRFCSDQCRKKAWSSRNEDKVKAQQKRRYEEHRDEVLARRRERYWSNVEQSRRVKRIKYEARKMESEVD
ncbi:MAG: hypothetical protein IJ087_01545, partial [Eggerthellaceae bacterium]|nr:hypothetical protein [Eggerthellaceae bacterium]